VCCRPEGEGEALAVLFCDVLCYGILLLLLLWLLLCRAAGVKVKV
jgi:hypothetical protein